MFELEQPTIPDLSDLSLYTLSPYAHVKIYQIRDPLSFDSEPDFGPDREVVFGRVSEAADAAVYVTRRASRVSWSTDDKLIDVHFDLFILYQERASSLLFICASSRVDGLYRRIARDLCGYDPRILGLSLLNRALKELEGSRFFNVGMRNRQHSSLTESYRMITGSNADQAIREEDARLFHRGHCFGSAIENGVDITIGLSSASKIWSNTSMALPDLLSWCANIARKVNQAGQAVTGSRLDILQMGEPVSAIPAHVLSAEWEKDVYVDQPLAQLIVNDHTHKGPLTDFDLSIQTSDQQRVVIDLSGGGLNVQLQFEIGNDPAYAYAGAGGRVELDHGRSTEDLIDYLNDNPLHLMLDDWSRLCGTEHFSAPEGLFQPFPDAQIRPIDWVSCGVDIQVEFDPRDTQSVSVHGFVCSELDASENDIVYCDHGSGEAADFIVMRTRGDAGVEIELYHCKGAAGPEAGNRVGDVYEVSMQAVKALIFCDLPRLAARISDRFKRDVGSARFVRGDPDAMMELSSRRPVTFQMVVVQPGVTRMDLQAKIGECLSAANYHLVRAGQRELLVWGSL